MHARRTNMQVFYQASTRRRKTQVDLNYTPSYSPTHGEFENLSVISVAPMICVSRVFVYEPVDVNKIITISSTKPPSYAYAQVTARLKLYLS